MDNELSHPSGISRPCPSALRPIPENHGRSRPVCAWPRELDPRCEGGSSEPGSAASRPRARRGNGPASRGSRRVLSGASSAGLRTDHIQLGRLIEPELPVWPMSGAGPLVGRPAPGERTAPRDIVFELSPTPENRVRDLSARLAMEFGRRGILLSAEASPSGPNGASILVRRYGAPALETSAGRSLRINVASTRGESLVPLMLSLIPRLLPLDGNGQEGSADTSAAYAANWCQPY